LASSHKILKKKIFFQARKRTGLNSSVAIDSTDCPIERPASLIQRLFYSGKSKIHCVKYEVGVDVVDGLIVWLYGCVPGSYHDLTITRMSGIAQHLLPGEFLFGDKAYTDPCFISPVRGLPEHLTVDQKTYNLVHSSIRVKVENTFARVKNFKIMSCPFRNDLTLHPIVFYVICNLVNVDIFLNKN
jgi:hypothetical protein